MESVVSFGLALLLAPLFPGVLLKTKALFAGKQGPPLLIKYFTLIKLLRKGSVYSDSATFVFRLGPLISCATAVMALLFFPFAGTAPLIAFHGDVIMVFYLLGLGRFFTIIAALDTASPFEGMGAAREAFFSTLAEAAIFVVLILFCRMNGTLSFAAYFSGNQPISIIGPQGALLLLVVVALFMILLTENSRVPVDDPATHLELTMIHEAMILEYSARHLALIEWAVALKLFTYSALGIALFLPWGIAARGDLAALPLALLAMVAKLMAGGAALSLLEAISAKVRLFRAPEFLGTAFLLGVLGMLIHFLLEV